MQILNIKNIVAVDSILDKKDFIFRKRIFSWVNEIVVIETHSFSYSLFKYKIF